MSKISLSGNANGTGTFTIASPNGNTDRTINLPDSNGTLLTTATPGVPVNGPAFSAGTANTKSAANVTQTEMAGYNSVVFDTASCFNTTTGRFTPTVPGYYQFNWSVDFGSNGIGAASVISAQIAKNGSSYWGMGIQTSSSCYGSVGTSTLVYMNGSTDFVSVYLFQNTGVTVSNFLAKFSGVMIRSAT
jgi:hypothetical protein